MNFWKHLRAAVNKEVNITHLSSIIEVSFVSGGFSYASIATDDDQVVEPHFFPVNFPTY